MVVLCSNSCVGLCFLFIASFVGASVSCVDSGCGADALVVVAVAEVLLLMVLLHVFLVLWCLLEALLGLI